MSDRFEPLRGDNPRAKQAFLEAVLQAMKVHGVSDAVLIYGLTDQVHNTCLSIDKEPDPLYANLSDGINAWLAQSHTN